MLLHNTCETKKKPTLLQHGPALTTLELERGSKSLWLALDTLEEDILFSEGVDDSKHAIEEWSLQEGHHTQKQDF